MQNDAHGHLTDDKERYEKLTADMRSRGLLDDERGAQLFQRDLDEMAARRLQDAPFGWWVYARGTTVLVAIALLTLLPATAAFYSGLLFLMHLGLPEQPAGVISMILSTATWLLLINGAVHLRG